jgi:hypothetical protein
LARGPVDIDTFVESREHLGLPPLFPDQREAMRNLLGDDATVIFEEGERDYQLAVCAWGKGSGKDYPAR